MHKESLEISMVQEYLNLPEPFRFEGGELIPKADSYELKLEDVTFRYPGTDRVIISHLNLTVHPGEKIAVVGLNGAGKTTLVKLLCGFYDPDEGRVLLNGTDIRRFNRQAYYGLFSAVFQEYSDLDVTVSQAVAQSVSDIDFERVKACIRKAGLTEKIESLPQGYETHLGKKVYADGIQLSRRPASAADAGRGRSIKTVCFWFWTNLPRRSTRLPKAIFTKIQRDDGGKVVCVYIAPPGFHPFLRPNFVSQRRRDCRRRHPRRTHPSGRRLCEAV